MNSRDAAYEEQVRAALEASRAEDAAEVGEEEVVEDAEPTEGIPEDKAPARKRKRKRDDDDAGERLTSGRGLTIESEGGATTAPNSSKPKHPNQYTYRPKSVINIQQAAAPAVPSPIRRVAHATTPVPSLPPPAQHEHGTRRAGAIANGTIPPPPNTISVSNLHWYLPDHLVQYADILPTPDPIALEARSNRALSYLPRNHFTNQKYGPFTEDRDEKGKLILPEDPGSRDITGNAHTQLEPPARVRYPTKRMTTADIRKRVRNMLEYVSKVQSEESRRKQRAEMIGINVNSLGKAIRISKDGEEIPEEDDLPEPTPVSLKIDEQAEQPTPRPPRQPAMKYGHGVSSDVLMDELMRDLIAFQESFTTGGGFGGLGGLGVSPLLPSMSTFGSAPPTPIMSNAASVPPAPSVPSVESGPVDSVGSVDKSDLAGNTESVETAADEEPVPHPDIVEPEAYILQQVTVTSPSHIMADTMDVASSDQQAVDAMQPEASTGQMEDTEMAFEEPSSVDAGPAPQEHAEGMDLDDLPIPSEMAGTDEPVTGLLGMPSMPGSNGSIEPAESAPAIDESSELQQPVVLPETVQPETLTAGPALGGEIKSIMGEMEPVSELETPIDVYREGLVDEVLTGEGEHVAEPEQQTHGIGVGSVTG